MKLYPDDEFTIEELVETCLLHGIIEEGDETEYEYWQLMEMLKDYESEAAAQDHYASFYSY